MATYIFERDVKVEEVLALKSNNLFKVLPTWVAELRANALEDSSQYIAIYRISRTHGVGSHDYQEKNPVLGIFIPDNASNHLKSVLGYLETRFNTKLIIPSGNVYTFHGK